MFILNNKIENKLNLALDLKYPLQAERIRVTVEALEPPFIQVSNGRHTSKVKIGKLLATLALPDKEVKELVEEYKEINGDLSQFTIKYSQDDYKEVYRHNLYAFGSTSVSCMTNMECVEVYEHDKNLELLTVWRKVNATTTILIGRTLVAWRNNEEEESVYVRCYIDHNYIKDFQMTALVVREGFVRGNLEGITIDKIEGSQGFVCPYLDGLSTLEDCGDYFKITRYGSYGRGDSTNGYMYDSSCNCGHCGDRVQEDDAYYISDMMICNYCIRDHYTDYNGEFYHNENCITTSDTNETIPLVCAGDVVGEDRNGDYYLWENLVSIDDEWYYIEEVHELAIEIDGDTRYAPKEDCIRLALDIKGTDEGWYLKEQIEEKVEELKESILNLQEEISLKGEFMLPNQELKDLLTDLDILEELL